MEVSSRMDSTDSAQQGNQADRRKDNPDDTNELTVENISKSESSNSFDCYSDDDGSDFEGFTSLKEHSLDLVSDENDSSFDGFSDSSGSTFDGFPDSWQSRHDESFEEKESQDFPKPEESQSPENKQYCGQQRPENREPNEYSGFMGLMPKEEKPEHFHEDFSGFVTFPGKLKLDFLQNRNVSADFDDFYESDGSNYESDDTHYFFEEGSQRRKKRPVSSDRSSVVRKKHKWKSSKDNTGLQTHAHSSPVSKKKMKLSSPGKKQTVTSSGDDVIDIKKEETLKSVDFIGNHCQAVGCTISFLESMMVINVEINNGIVYELSEFARSIAWEKIFVAKWLQRLTGIKEGLVEPTEDDIDKINTLLKRRKALQITSSIHSSGSKLLKDFDATVFILPSASSQTGKIDCEQVERKDPGETAVDPPQNPKTKEKNEDLPRVSSRGRIRKFSAKGRQSGEIKTLFVQKEDSSPMTSAEKIVENKSKSSTSSSQKSSAEKIVENNSKSSTNSSQKSSAEKIVKSKRKSSSKLYQPRKIKFKSSRPRHGKKSSEGGVDYVFKDGRFIPKFTNTDYKLGKYCAAAGLSVSDLNEEGPKDIIMTRGMIKELCAFYTLHGCAKSALAVRLFQISDLEFQDYNHLLSLCVRFNKLRYLSHNDDEIMKEEFHMPVRLGKPGNPWLSIRNQERSKQKRKKKLLEAASGLNGNFKNKENEFAVNTSAMASQDVQIADSSITGDKSPLLSPDGVTSSTGSKSKNSRIRKLPKYFSDFYSSFDEPSGTKEASSYVSTKDEKQDQVAHPVGGSAAVAVGVEYGGASYNVAGDSPILNRIKKCTVTINSCDTKNGESSFIVSPPGKSHKKKKFPLPDPALPTSAADNHKNVVHDGSEATVAVPGKKKSIQAKKLTKSKLSGNLEIKDDSDNDVANTRGKVGTVTRGDIIFLYTKWLKNKRSGGSSVFVTDLLKDVEQLMTERQVEPIRIPAGTLMSSSVRLHDEYQQMRQMSQEDAIMYLEEDWLEDIQYLVSVSAPARRSTTDTTGSISGESHLDDIPMEPVAVDSDDDSEKDLVIDESAVQNESVSSSDRSVAEDVSVAELKHKMKSGLVKNADAVKDDTVTNLKNVKKGKRGRGRPRKLNSPHNSTLKSVVNRQRRCKARKEPTADAKSTMKSTMESVGKRTRKGMSVMKHMEEFDMDILSVIVNEDLDKSQLSITETQDAAALSTSTATQQEVYYEVERIIDNVEVYNSKTKAMKYRYLVRWLGFGEGEDCWVDEENLHCPKILEKYWKNMKKKKNKNPKKLCKSGDTGLGTSPEDSELFAETNNSDNECSSPVTLQDKENGLNVVDVLIQSVTEQNERDTKNMVTKQELLELYDAWRQENQGVLMAGGSNAVSLEALTERVSALMSSRNLSHCFHPESILSSCFIMTLMKTRLTSEETLRKYLDSSCIEVLEANHKQQCLTSQQSLTNKNTGKSIVVTNLQKDIDSLKQSLNEAKKERAVTRCVFGACEEELACLEAVLKGSQDDKQKKAVLLQKELDNLKKDLLAIQSSEAKHKVLKLPKKKKKQEAVSMSSLVLSAFDKSKKKMEEAGQELVKCGVAQQKVDSLLNFVIEKMAVS